MYSVVGVLRWISRLWGLLVQSALVILCALAITALLLFDRYNHPVTVVSQPAQPGTIVALDEPIVVTFSTPMNRTRAEQALRLTPEQPISLYWEADDTVLRIAPAALWRAEQSYTVTFTPELRSATLATVEPWQLVFTTRAVLRVAHLYPTNLASEIDPATPIVVRFTQQMVPRSRVHTTLAIPLIQVTPALLSTQTWLDTRTVLVRPQQPLEPGKQYRITVPAAATDAVGRKLGQPVIHDFTTTAPLVPQVEPADGTTGVAAESVLGYQLPGRWDPAIIRANLSLSPEIAYDLDVRQTDGFTDVRVVPIPAWAPATTYTLRQLALSARQPALTSSFTTAPALSLVAQSPADGQPLLPNRELRFVFSGAIDPTTVAGAVHFSPEPIRTAEITATGNTVRIRGTWASQSAPVIRIDTSLRGTNGYALAADIIQTFVVDPRSTVLSLPGAPTDIIDLSTTLRLPVTMAPHTRATLTITAFPPETLALLRARRSAEWTDYDAQQAGFRPLVTIPITTELEPTRLVDLTEYIAAAPARIVYARVTDTTGAVDARFLRIATSQLVATVLDSTVAAAVSPQATSPRGAVDAYHDGVLLPTGTADANGVWSYRALASGLVGIVDPATPYDYIERRIAPAPASQSVRLLADARVTTVDTTLTVACVRRLTDRNESGTVSLTDAQQTPVRAQPILWRVGQAIVTARLSVPETAALGPAVVRCSTADTRYDSALLLAPRQTEPVTVSRTYVRGVPTLTLRDAAGRPLAGVTLSWFTNAALHHTTTSTQGTAHIPVDVDLAALSMQTASIRYQADLADRPTLAYLPLDGWYPADERFTIALQTTAPSVSVTVTGEATAANNAPIRITPVAGTATLPLQLAAGQYTLIADDGSSTRTATIVVGAVAGALLPRVAADTDPVAIEWSTAATGAPALWVERHDEILVTRWYEAGVPPVVTTQPISTTSRLRAALSTPTEHTTSPVVDIESPACRQASISAASDHTTATTVTVVAPPQSAFVLAADTPLGSTPWLATATIDGASDRTILRGPPRPLGTQIRVLITGAACTRTLETIVSTAQTPTLTYEAPAQVAIGDVVTVRLRATGLVSDTLATVTLDTVDSAVVNPIPVYTTDVVADGTAIFSWQIRILRAAPTVTFSMERAASVLWQPLVRLPAPQYSADGFVLTGRTAVDASRAATRLDILATPTDLAAAIDADGLAAPTAAHRAHLLWLRNGRHTIAPLRSDLLQQQLPSGDWGDDGSAQSDPLITADVTIALVESATLDPRRPQRIAVLQRAAEDTTLPLSQRAHAIAALAALGERAPAASQTLYALRDTMGSEGVAALIRSATAYPNLDPRPLVAILETRARAASRGVVWAPDPSTSALHSPVAQNIYIHGALVAAGAPAALIAASRDYIHSARGTGGWGDAIANARAWALHTTLYPTLTGTQRITISDDTGAQLSTGAQATPLTLRSSVSVWSDAPVVVGIDYPRSPVAPTQSVLLAPRYTDATGAPRAHLALLTVGTTITVTTDVVAFAEHPYLRVVIPSNSLTDLELVSVPTSFAIQSDATGYTLIAHGASAGVWRITYRLTARRAGTTTVVGMSVSDAAQTLHAAQPDETLYVSDR